MMHRYARRGFLATAAAAAAGVVCADETAKPWQSRWILASALYGTFSLEEILPEVRKTGATMIDLWPKPHGSQREEIDSLGVEKVREMLAAADIALGGIACYMVGPFNLAGEFAIAKRLGAESPVLVTMAPGDGGLKGDDLTATLARDLRPKLKFVYAQEHGKGSKEKLPKADELLQMPGRGPFDFGPLMRELAAMNFAGPIEIFMHPVPRGVPILESVAEITAEVNRARGHLMAAVAGEATAK